MMGMFSNGCNDKRSSSLVMIQSALPETASSRYMLSLGSRQTSISMVTGTLEAFNSYSSRNNCLTDKERYRSNFGRITTSIASARVALETIQSTFANSDRFNAKPENEYSFSNAQISTLLSNTICIYSPLRRSSRISGVNPFCLACSLASWIISERFLRLDTRRSRLLAINSFSIGVILAILSAVGSLTSKVIVFILQR